GIGERRADRLLGAAALEMLVAGAEHQSLHAPPAGHQLEALAQEAFIVAMRLRVEEMDRRKVALATLGCGKSAEASNRQRAHRNPAAREFAHDQIETRAMTADNDEIGNA